MLEAITALFARERMSEQFDERRPSGRPTIAQAAPAERPAVVRRTGARVLRILADRIEPAPRYAPQQ
jgi:hypothetical protein